MGEAKDRLEVFVGGVCASVFPFMYYAVALYLAATVAQFARLVVFGMGNASFVVGLATPALLSLMMANWHRKRDAAPFPALFMTYVFKCLNSYFDYHEFLELSDDMLYEEMDRKPVIMAVAPHGVLSFGGLCGLCYDFADYDEMKKNADGKDSVDVKRRNQQYLNMSEHDKQSFRLRELLPKLPTAMADILLTVPILSDVMQIFGVLSASRQTLERRIAQRKSFILYPGGLSEMFFSNAEKKTEKLFLKERKGFIKLALRHGADIVPAYLFGNTKALRILDNPLLSSLSRRLRVSLTVMYGRFFLPVPFRVEIVHVRGRLIKLPHIEREPTEDEVNKYHALYIAELRRLFDTHKKKTRDYRDTELVIL